MPPSADIEAQEEGRGGPGEPEPPHARSGASGDRLLGEPHDVEGHPCLPQLLGEIGLDPGAFTDDGVHRLEGQDAVIAHERGAVAKASVEAELNDLDPARGGPGMGDGIAAFGLCGGGEDHFRNSGLDAVETGDVQRQIR